MGERNKMYPFNIHILFYVLFCVLGVISGQIASWCIKRMPEHKKVLSTDFFKEFKPDYKMIIVMIVLYMTLLLSYGIKNQFLNKKIDFLCKLYYNYIITS